MLSQPRRRGVELPVASRDWSSFVVESNPSRHAGDHLVHDLVHDLVDVDHDGRHRSDDDDDDGALVVPGPFGPAWLLVPLPAGASGQVWVAELGDGHVHERAAADGLVVLKRQRPSLRVDIGEVLHNVSRLRGHVLQNVVVVEDFGVLGGFGWVATAYVEGVDLHVLQTLAADTHRPLKPDMALALAIGVLDGLSSLHEVGLVHRDLGPANVVVGSNGSVTIVDVDFVVPAGTAATDTVPGNVSYMSPEQAQGLPVDGRADLVGWAIMACELFTGDTFYGDLSLDEISTSTRTGGYRPRRFLDVPVPLRQVIERSLRGDPADRYQSAARCRQALLEAAVAAEITMADTRAVAALVADLAGDSLARQRQRFAHAREGVSSSSESSALPVRDSMLVDTLELRTSAVASPSTTSPTTSSSHEPSASVMRPRSRHGAGVVVVVVAVVVVVVLALIGVLIAAATASDGLRSPASIVGSP
jgi:serine/threonine protein kinase